MNIPVTREQKFLVTTPYHAAPQVVCYVDTWAGKIIDSGRVSESDVSIVIETLEKPTSICVGTTNLGYVAYINQNWLSPNSGAPFVVFIDPNGVPLPAVASVGHRRDFSNLAKHSVLWVPS